MGSDEGALRASDMLSEEDEMLMESRKKMGLGETEETKRFRVEEQRTT